MRLRSLTLGTDHFRFFVILGLIGLFGMLVLVGGSSSSAIGLVLPLAIVGLVWATPLAVNTINGERWSLIFFTVCLFLFSMGSFRARGWDDQSLDWQVLAKLFVWLAAGGIAAFNLPRILPLLRHPHIAILGFFVALIPLSTLWAVDKVYALSSGMFHLFLFAFALTLVERLGQRWAIIAMACGAGVLVIPSLLMSPFMTSFGGISDGSTGELDRVRGLTGHPVALAMISGIFAVCMVYIIERKWMPRLLGWALLAMAIATILVSQSRMPAMALLAAGGLTVLIRKQMFGFATPFIALPLILITLVMLAFGADLIITEDVLRMISRSGRPEEILSLSGRSEIWPFVMRHIAEAPILGHGQGAGPAILLTGFQGWSLIHAHNLFLQTALCLGLVGLAILVVGLMLQVQLAIVYQRTFPLLMVSFLCLLGVTEASFFTNLPDANFIAWSVAVAMTLPQDHDGALLPLSGRKPSGDNAQKADESEGSSAAAA
ncbi:MAG: O-antigen ligase family protein [Pseudomonadota bacterium]